LKAGFLVKDGPQNRGRDSKSKAKLEKKVSAKAGNISRGLPIGSDDIDTVATWAAVCAGAVAGIVELLGHTRLAVSISFLMVWFAVLAIVAHAHEKKWRMASWLIRGHPWLVAAIAAVLIATTGGLAISRMPGNDRDSLAAARLASRSDILSGEKFDRFVEFLQTLPPDSVFLVRTEDSREASEFSGVVEDALTMTGRLAGYSIFTNSGMTPNPPGRVVVHPNGPANKRYADTIVAALAAAGIPDVAATTFTPPLVSDAPITIFIKAK
jgi:hypothetical protein